jgi:adenylate kinase
VISKYLRGLVGIVYIDATTDELLSRRSNDKLRIREAEDRMIIEMQRAIHAAMLAYYSIQLNIPIYVINNEENSLKESIKAFKNALKDMTGS